MPNKIMCKGCGSYYREGKEEEHLLSRKHCHVMDISYKNGKKRFSMDSRFSAIGRPTINSYQVSAVRLRPILASAWLPRSCCVGIEPPQDLRLIPMYVWSRDRDAVTGLHPLATVSERLGLSSRALGIYREDHAIGHTFREGCAGQL